MGKICGRDKGNTVVSSVAIILLLSGFMALGRVSVVCAQEADYPSKPVLFFSPGAPGGGYDTTLRAIANTLAKEKLVKVAMPVENAPSVAGGLADVVNRHKGNPYVISMGSDASMNFYGSGTLPYSHKDFTPLCSLATTYYGIAVKYDSPYKTMGDLIKDLKAKPADTPITIGTGDFSFDGAMLLKAGVDPRKVNHVVFNGGAQGAMLIMEGSAKAGINSVDEFIGLVEAKKLRLLAISSAKRSDKPLLKDVATLRESGVDFEWGNTRFMIAPPGVPGYAVKYWRTTFAKMVKTPTWQEMLVRYQWSDYFMVEGFDAWLDKKQAMIMEALTVLGMAKKN